MALALTADERAMQDGRDGPAVALALSLLCELSRRNGADRLIPVASAHVAGWRPDDDRGVAFAERLQAEGGRVRVPTTLGAGGLDLLQAGGINVSPGRRDLALRLSQAYDALGCRATWTDAPYQAGHRPRRGEDVAWAGGSAVAFCNSVLGARSNQQRDQSDLCAALSGRVPCWGLHLPENRRARVVVETAGLPARLKACDGFFPVLGSWLGAELGDVVAVIEGLPTSVSEDQLKALADGAAAAGAVGMFHVAGVTPEAPSARAALGGEPPERTVALTPATIRAARDRLSTATGDELDAVAVGGPHFSLDEFAQLIALLRGRRSMVPFQVCTSRHVVEALRRDDRLQVLAAAGVTLVADAGLAAIARSRCALMTSSAAIAGDRAGGHAAFGSLEDCVASAVAGRIVRDERPWW
jgi:predicted aconitase